MTAQLCWVIQQPAKPCGAAILNLPSAFMKYSRTQCLIFCLIGFSIASAAGYMDSLPPDHGHNSDMVGLCLTLFAAAAAAAAAVGGNRLTSSNHWPECILLDRGCNSNLGAAACG
eukprot:CAMPEP_0172677462 /NCGR_PEP_ID=MMETSP1074-20121228/14687_1 /TAXON_ID=2916 /ORGANISM="Ceratium fusus, Strain PA161109" /LENGTH=114 /DNA_ID=CAMNT_0013495297 /DNA_START=188 /DNA_END=532 /DNA_ORIENTATION=-